VKFQYQFHDLFNPLIQALNNLGGSASIEELENEVSKILKLTDDQVNEIHKGSRTKLSYRLAWARTYLKKYGLIDNSARGVWTLTEMGKNTKSVSPQKVVSVVRGDVQTPTDEPIEVEIHETQWQNKLIEHVQTLTPQEFERLCQRLLRESGFVNVVVTGRAGDGGIDGKGLFRMAGVISFNVYFQAKRYVGSISPSVVRDFRGALQGRADKGLIITTGTFTKAAKDEAQRDGAIAIDLMDGWQLAEKLKEYRLGVNVQTIEDVNLNKEWFHSL